MPKPDTEKSRNVKPKTAPVSRSASARTGATVIAMVPRQHAAPQNDAAAAAGFATMPVPPVEWRREGACSDTMRARATIAVAAFLLGALACYVTLEYRAGRAAGLSADAASAQHAQASDPRRARQ